MNLRLALAASCLALAACQPATPPASESAAAAPPVAETATAIPAGGCDVRVEAPWINEAARRYAIEANVSGPSCKQGVVMIVVRQGDGTPVYSWSGLTNYLFGLRDAADPAAMKAALTEWFSRSADVETTATLPPWEQTEGQPARAEFPFMPADWINKEAWDDLRNEKLAMLCFPQGIESMQCSVLRQGEAGQPSGLEEIGLQLFPG